MTILHCCEDCRLPTVFAPLR